MTIANKKTESENPSQDFNEATRFLDLLGGQFFGFTFQTFDDNADRKDRSLARVLHGSIHQHWDELVKLNNQGAGVFVTINETDLKGRKKENISAIRAVWQEDDSGSSPELPLEPHIVVESSPGKFHRYILTKVSKSNDPQQFKQFGSVMQRMVQDYGSDPNATDLSRVLRLPGFFHQKCCLDKLQFGESHMVKIVSESSLPPLSWDDLLERIPPVDRKSNGSEGPENDDESHSLRNLISADTLRDLENALVYLAPNPINGRSGETQADNRGTWVGVGHDLRHLGGRGLKLFHQFSAHSKKYDFDEVNAAWESIKEPKSHYKNVFKKARDAGWQNPKSNSLDSRDQATEHLASPQLRLMPIREVIGNRRKPDWLIKGVFETNTMITLIAPPASCKTFVAVDWALSIASGLPWNDQKVNQGSVAIIAGEGQGGYWRRFRAWGIENEVEVEDLPVFLSDRAAELFDEADGLIQAIEEAGRPDLIVIDTLSRNAGAADENSTADMAKVVANIDRIKAHFGCAILIVHHTPLNDKSRGRGSSVLFGAVDFEYLIIRKDKEIRISCNKSKDHEPPKPIALNVKSVNLGEKDEDGKNVTSIVLADAEYYRRDTRRMGANQKDVLKEINRIYASKSENDSHDMNTFLCEVTRDELIGVLPNMNRQRMDEALRGLEKRECIKKVADGWVPL